MPIVSGGGGGGAAYTPPITQELTDGTGVSIADGAGAALTWGNNVSGTALLNVTTADTPTIVTAGIYSFAVNIRPSALTAAGWYEASLELAPLALDAQISVDSPIASATLTRPYVLLVVTWYMAAGASVQAFVTSHDGVAARTFAITAALVQRIT